MSIRELLCDMAGESAIVFDGPDYDDAIVGVSHDDRVIYDYDAMVGILMDDGMSEEEAVDFIDYNTIRSIPYAGPQAPIVMTRLIKEDGA